MGVYSNQGAGGMLRTKWLSVACKRGVRALCSSPLVPLTAEHYKVTRGDFATVS